MDEDNNALNNQNADTTEPPSDGGAPRPTRLCSACNKPTDLYSKVCENCGYREQGGYVPMTPQKIRKIKTALFLVLMIVAVVVIIVTRM